MMMIAEKFTQNTVKVFSMELIPLHSVLSDIVRLDVNIYKSYRWSAKPIDRKRYFNCIILGSLKTKTE